MVKTLPSKAGDTGSIPSQGTKIPHAAGQLSPSAATAEPTSSRVCALKLENLPPARKTQHSCPPNKENIQEVSVLLPARNTEHLPEGHGEWSKRSTRPGREVGVRLLKKFDFIQQKGRMSFEEGSKWHGWVCGSDLRARIKGTGSSKFVNTLPIVRHCFSSAGLCKPGVQHVYLEAQP